MGAAAQLLEDEDLEPEEVEDEPPTRVSFFADPESELVHDSVCLRVWNIFARESTALGFDCRSRHSINATMALTKKRRAANAHAWDRLVSPSPKLPARSVLPEEPAKEETKTMPKEPKPLTDPLTERETSVLNAYNALLGRLGRLPSDPELLEVLDAEAWASRATVRVARAALVRRGLAKVRPRGTVENSGGGASSVPRDLVVKKRAKAAPAPCTTPGNGAVTTLIAKRDDLRRKADALDVAIEMLSG